MYSVIYLMLSCYRVGKSFFNQTIYDIERADMEPADKVITVSHFARDILISRYGNSGYKSRSCA